MPEAFEVGPIKATLRADYQQYEASFSSIIKQTQQLDAALATVDESIRASETATKAVAAAQQQATTTSAALATASRQVATMTEAVDRETRGASVSLERYVAESRRAEAATEGLNGALTRVGNVLAKNSIGGRLVQTLLGGGAVGLATLVIGQVQQQIDAVVRARTALQAGEIGQGEYADQIARSIPLLGQVYSLGRSIRELVVGEEGIAKGIEASAKRINDVLDAMQALAKATDEYRKNAADANEQLNRSLRDLTVDPAEATIARNIDAYRDAVKQIQDGIEAAQKSAPADTLRAEIRKAEAILPELRQRVVDAQAEYETAFRNKSIDPTALLPEAVVSGEVLRQAQSEVQSTVNLVARARRQLAELAAIEAEARGQIEGQTKLLGLQNAEPLRQIREAALAVGQAYDSITEAAGRLGGGAAGLSFAPGVDTATLLAEQGAVALEKLDAAQRASAESLKSVAEALTDSLRTPLEKYQDEVAKADRLRKANLISDATYRRALEAADQTFAESLQSGLRRGGGGGGGGATSAVAYGTQAAADLIAAQLARGNDEAALSVARQQLEEARRSTGYLGKIAGKDGVLATYGGL